MQRTQDHFYDIPMKDPHAKYNHEETSGKPKYRNILQNNCPVNFLNSKTEELSTAEVKSDMPTEDNM